MYSRGREVPRGSRALRRTDRGRARRRREPRARRDLDRASARRRVGRRPPGQSPASRERVAARGRLRLGGLRARGLPRSRERRRSRTTRSSQRTTARSPRSSRFAARSSSSRSNVFSSGVADATGRRQLFVAGQFRLASGIGSPCGSWVGKPSARSMRASSSSEITCSSRSASSCTASTCRPEGLREIQLEQPVVPDHLESDAFARVGQLRAAVRLVRE